MNKETINFIHSGRIPGKDDQIKSQCYLSMSSRTMTLKGDLYASSKTCRKYYKTKKL